LYTSQDIADTLEDIVATDLREMSRELD